MRQTNKPVSVHHYFRAPTLGIFEEMNIFRYDDAGRLAEEWIETDNLNVLRQLGAEGR